MEQGWIFPGRKEHRSVHLHHQASQGCCMIADWYGEFKFQFWQTHCQICTNHQVYLLNRLSKNFIAVDLQSFLAIEFRMFDQIEQDLLHLLGFILGDSIGCSLAVLGWTTMLESRNTWQFCSLQTLKDRNMRCCKIGSWPEMIKDIQTILLCHRCSHQLLEMEVLHLSLCAHNCMESWWILILSFL